MKTFFAFYNGQKTFKIKANLQTRHVEIYDQIHDDKPLVLSTHYKDLFSPALLQNFNRRIEGGSALLYLFNDDKNDDNNDDKKKNNAHKYVFVGQNMFSFETSNLIDYFCSPVGNSGVPYPYAVDRSNSAYLMLENIVITPNEFNTEKLLSSSSPYFFYYESKLITEHNGFLPPKQPLYDFESDIKEWFVEQEDGEREQYALAFSFNPNDDKRYENKKMFIRKKSTDEIVSWSYQEFITLREQVKQKLGFQEFQKLQMIK
jgi:hypothetical protein